MRENLRVQYTQLIREDNTSHRIMVEHGLRREIMERFGTSYPTVRSALEFRTHSLLAQSIRKYALEHGGVLMGMVQDK